MAASHTPAAYPCTPIPLPAKLDQPTVAVGRLVGVGVWLRWALLNSVDFGEALWGESYHFCCHT